MLHTFQQSNKNKRPRVSNTSSTSTQMSPPHSPRSPKKKVVDRYNDPDTSGEYDDVFPTEGKGSGPGPVVPTGPIDENDRQEAINCLRERIEWLEGRESHYLDKMTAQHMELLKLKQDAKEAKKALQVESIKATLKTIQGISTANKRLMTMPHDMDAAHQRIHQYGLHWSNIKIPPRDINPVEVPISIIDYDMAERARVKDHPDDKAYVPLNMYMRAYEHKAGTAKHKEDGAGDDTSRGGGRGNSNPRYRGYRGRGSGGYRGN